MANIVAAPVAQKVVENLFALIGRHVGYMWNYSKNILDVNQQIEKLRDGRLRVQQSVDEANRQGDEIFPDVQKWLSRAEEMLQETDKFIEDEKEANRGCFHLKLRYQHSKKAKKQAGDIVDKIEEADNLTRRGVAHPPPPPGIGFSSIRGSEFFNSRETTLNQIMEALRDDGIRMIGVWGMGGVGKTTLVQQLAKRAQVAKQANEEKLFDTVVMALNISQTPNVKKIQGEIASILGLKLEERDESARAVHLCQSLKKNDKILVILDDIWEPIAFERIGIPYGPDEHPNGYCKVLLTSREHHVLSKDMGTHKDFHVQHLCEEEAWSLFKQTVGDFVEKPELQYIATEVVKECEGLPVAIVTIAKALKGESMGVWKNALEELKRSTPTNIRGVSKNVYSCLELSYNYLESNEAKSLFLLCGLLGDEDISLNDLLKYGMGLSLFDYMDSLEKARDKVVALVTILKASSLLINVAEDAQTYRPRPSSLFVEEEGNGYVRMHDVIRDVARSIASKDPHQFVVHEDISLQEWEKRGVELRNYSGMSLKCRRVQELPEGLVCPKLGFFLLNSDSNTDDSLIIPDTFFDEMKAVRVLSLSGVDLTRLPSSLHFLSNLRTLCLYGLGQRSRLKDIAMVGDMKKLQILSFVDCEIGELPEAMKQMSDLRMLSLRGCPAIIPRNVISSLSRLEHLCWRNNIFHRWETEEVGERNAWFYELKHLTYLRALEVEIPGSYLLREDVSFDNLTRYDIYIGHETDWYVDRINTSRRLKLDGEEGPHLVKCFSKLLKTIEVLDLTRLNGTRHFVNELDYDGFLHLKHLSISWSGEMQYIMNSTILENEMERINVDDPPPSTAFPLLEKLKLENLHNLVALCHGPIPMGCFANLRILIIQFCDRLKCLLWLPTAQGRESDQVFPQLQRLEMNYVQDLFSLYSVGTSGSQEPSIIPLFNHQVAVPRLELLRLRTMVSVRTIWHNQHHVGSYRKLKELELLQCDNLQTVFPSNCLEEGLQSLQILEIKYCGSLKEIFEINCTSAVSPLKESSLHGQGNKDSQGYHAFRSLNSLTVTGCPSLKYIFPTSVAKGLVQLEVLDISDCGVEEIVANEIEFEAVEAPIFLFPKLTSLKLSNLRQLKRFYQEKYTLECPLLKELKVSNCDNVELLFQEKSLQDCEVSKQPLFLVDKNTFSNVNGLVLSNLKGAVEIWGGQFSRESFGKLRKLDIYECHNISVGIPSTKLQALHNLEKLTLRRCNSVKEVIQVDHEGLHVVLPRLTKMYLADLPMLKHLSASSGLGPILQNLHSLHVSQCGNLINLTSPSVAKSLVRLKKLSVIDCSMVEEIVGDDDACFSTELDRQKKPAQLDQHLVNLENFSSSFAFPSLEEMEVRLLPKLTHLFKQIPPGLDHINLQKLRVLQIYGCENIEIALTLSMAKTLVHLQYLTVMLCDKVKEIVENGGGGDEATEHEITFNKLEWLKLMYLPNLKIFCSAIYTFRFPSLTEMWVIGCPDMEYFCMGDSITQNLEGVTVDDDTAYWENNLNATVHKMFTVLNAQHSEEEDLDERDSEEGEDSEEEVLYEENAEEGDSEELYPKVEDSLEEETKQKKDSEGGRGSLG